MAIMNVRGKAYTSEGRVSPLDGNYECAWKGLYTRRSVTTLVMDATRTANDSMRKKRTVT